MKTRILLVLALSCYGCEPQKQLPQTTPNGGFFVQTFGQDATSTSTNPVPFPVSNVQVQGQWQDDSCAPPYAPAGDASTWTYTSNPVIIVWNGRTCAHWKFFWQSGIPWAGCASLPGAVGYVPGGNPNSQVMDYTCRLSDAGPILADALGISFSPNPTFTDVISGTITANGPGFSSANGMPLFQYFDQNGTLVAQTNATSVAADGNSASGPVPSNIGSVPPGVYMGTVSNAAPGGSYAYLNGGGVTVANGGVTIDGLEQSTDVCTRWLVGGDCQIWRTVYDRGTVSITINGVTSPVSYGQNDTPYTHVTALANAINPNTTINTLVSATAWGTEVLINVTQSGSHYSLSATASSSDPNNFPD